jgi:hypothetical protein
MCAKLTDRSAQAETTEHTQQQEVHPKLKGLMQKADESCVELSQLRTKHRSVVDALSAMEIE